MPLTNLASVNLVQPLYPTLATGSGANGADQLPGNTITNPVGLVGAAVDGELKAANKVVGGPDFIFTGDISAAETVNFTVPFASLLTKYAAQISGQTFLVIKARVFINAAAVANCYFSEIVHAFKDVAGAMTVLPGVAVPAFVAPITSPPTAPVATNAGSNVFQLAVSGLAAVAKNARVELYVDHVV